MGNDQYGSGHQPPPEQGDTAGRGESDWLLGLLTDAGFARVTALAARLTGAPMAAISIAADGRTLFRACHGIELPDPAGEAAYTYNAVFAPDAARVAYDIRKDTAGRSDPSAIALSRVRFYAGMPLALRDGTRVGALCVFDRRPRRPKSPRIDNLRDLASLLAKQIDLLHMARQSEVRQDYLVKEMNHRIANSLHVVSHLLSLQGRAVGEMARRSLAAAAGRIEAVAAVHRRLYLADGVGMIDFKSYLDDLCANIRRAVSAAEQRHVLIVEADPVDLPSWRATALGLIVNELVTNAVKHAYADGEAGPIAVGFFAASDEHRLTVADEGRGLPDHVDPASARGIGMRIIRTLVQQLGGTIAFTDAEVGRGTLVSVRYRPDAARPD